MDFSEIEEYKAFLNSFLSKAKKNKNLETFSKVDKFLNRIGMPKKRNFAKLDLVEDYLKSIGLRIYFYKDYGDTQKAVLKKLSFFERDDYIYFKLKKQKTKSIDDSKIKTQITISGVNTFEITQKKLPINLFKHQIDSIKELNKVFNNNTRKGIAGILVLPTGAGKTATAVTWINKNIIAKSKKVLWIAHRHELLLQAQSTVKKLANIEDMKGIKSLNTKIIAGNSFDKISDINASDNIIFGSKDSIYNGLNFIIDIWLKNEDELFVVVDEAHHTAAKTYRKLLDKIKYKIPNFNLLGLTATPSRTIESENHLLLKYFPENIIYSVNLRDLITEGILSEPKFEEFRTNTELKLDIDQIKSIKQFKKLDIETINKLIKDDRRNNLVVSTYANSPEKYGQTLVFAINQEHAITLKRKFEKFGIKSEFIISNSKNLDHDSISRKKMLDDFKNKKIQVLINVTIFSEGTDIPNVESVFLTRPTMSSILMTQMVGRGLRGVKSGGTEKALIVSFVDKWNAKINWVSPKFLFMDNIEGEVSDEDKKERQVKTLVADKLSVYLDLIEYDKSQKNNYLNSSFIEKIPIGLYYFKYITQEFNEDNLQDEEVEIICDILIFSSHSDSYKKFIDDLDTIFTKIHKSKSNFLNYDDLTKLADYVEKNYFEKDVFPHYERIDIEDILSNYFVNEDKPKFIEFSERRQLDLSKFAREIIIKDMRQSQVSNYIEEIWKKNKLFWEIFFNDNFSIFMDEITREVNRLRMTDKI